nr:poly (ADP ribose) polymerase [Hymenolepis microstoma]
MDRESEEFIRIAEYLRATHAPTHSNYTLDIVHIFVFSKESEAGKFKALEKRTLLWRGSRRTKIAGLCIVIGLKVFELHLQKLPVQAALSPLITVTLLLLLLMIVLRNVDLGKVNERFSAEESQLAKKFSSRHDPETGVVYPIGEPVTSANVKSDLLHNEYIVYGTTQIQPRYLVRVDNKYKF